MKVQSFSTIVFSASLAFAALQVIPIPATLPTSISASCRATLATNITQCPNIFMLPPDDVPNTNLNALCTSACRVNLSYMVGNATTRCGNTQYPTTIGTSKVIIQPLLMAGRPLYNFDLVCLQDSGTYCKPQLVNITTAQECSKCNLMRLQKQLNNPYDYHLRNASSFSSLLKSCSVASTVYPLTYTPSISSISSTSTAVISIPPCIQTYKPAATDTPESVAILKKVPTDRLLQYNNLPLNHNTTFPTGKVLCLDNVSPCFLQKVSATDTCSSFLQAIGYNVTENMFRSWNPTIGMDCTNLKYMINKYICLSPPDTTTKFTMPPVVTPTGSGSSTSSVSSIGSWSQAPPASVTAATSAFWSDPLPVPTKTTVNATVPASILQAVSDRGKYCPFGLYEGEILPDNQYRLGKEDLPEVCLSRHWNKFCTITLSTPALPSPTTIPASCYPTIVTETADPAKPPAPTNSGTTELCNQWRVAVSGQGCNAMVEGAGITMARLFEWNRSLNSQCTNMVAGMAYCVGIREVVTTATTSYSRVTFIPPPAPTQSGASNKCIQWHIRRAGDTCASIATLYGIILGRFLQLNRGVDSSCTNLVTGNAYCVWING
ncbi:hypothetical protein TWF106_000153 [Orbilia oligospora]|uniref:LysM domain-containing protein n=1 Tax=Orbilia oligospora TaxID=2813651 RepID=A0A7C8VE23_ORBOL|nr:hypothetical protein TWF679_007003 [Orbilia oligospora]KAF3229693.1 hypothetical protein TWF106_000081 [Orbilia oligospora]KAF3229765.1 hypothetical protein TWF106_000153 [Orbilia oligospora]